MVANSQIHSFPASSTQTEFMRHREKSAGRLQTAKAVNLAETAPRMVQINKLDNNRPVNHQAAFYNDNFLNNFMLHFSQNSNLNCEFY